MTDSAHDILPLPDRIRRITDYVRDCEVRVNRGEVMDLQGLDSNVAEVCTVLADMPLDDARRLEGQMGKLIDALDLLALAIKQQQDGDMPHMP